MGGSASYTIKLKFFIQFSCEAEVTNFYHFVLNEDVLILEIPMDDSFQIQFIHALYQHLGIPDLGYQLFPFACGLSFQPF